MDPNTALETMRNYQLDIEERADNAAALLSWLAHDGYVPGLPQGRTKMQIHGDRQSLMIDCGMVIAQAWRAR